MKKLLALLLVAGLVLVGCGSNKDEPNADSKVKVGTAVVNSVRNNNVGENERNPETGKFESNVTYATVIIEDDKVKAVSIDTAQNEVLFTESEIQEFVVKGTKKELGDKYGMGKIPNGKGEWDKQIAEVEKYMVGKSVSELKADAAASDLSSSVSMDINGYFEVVNLAITNAVEVNGAAKFGQTSTTSASIKDGEVQINTVVSALTTDKDGKVVHSFIDETQQIAQVDGGTVTPDANLKTKGQQKEAYGMSENGMVEWYLQVDEINKFLVGKTADAMKSFEADIPATVSIYAGGFQATVTKAFENLKSI